MAFGTVPRCFPAREPCACAPAPVEHAAEKERAAGAGRGGTGERGGEQPVCRVALAALTLGCVELALGPEGRGALVGVAFGLICEHWHERAQQ